jgi:acetyl esterase/lipase
MCFFPKKTITLLARNHKNQAYMKSIFFVIGVLWVCSSLAQDFSLKVWPAGPPTSNGMTQAEEVLEGNRVRNVSEAELYVYLPKQGINTRAAAIICPGGAYIMESMSNEGSLMAEWLASQGIAGIVLKYRLPYGHHEVPLDDAQRAIRIVRQKAVEWGIAPSKIGIAGSSAGGHLASTAGTHFDLGDPDSTDPIERISCRPDFMLLIYPVISLTEDFGHIGSRTNLIGTGNKWDLVEKYSNQFHVTPQTPPTFLILADDDVAVPARNSVEFYLALKKNKIPAEMHIYRTGGHGFGIAKKNLPVDYWPNLFIDWMKVQGITK